MSSGKETRSIFLAGVHHAYAQTDGTYAWPNSREGDLLRQGMREVERLRAELAAERATTASLLRIIALIREAGWFTREDLEALPDAVKAMRQQRDEARRMICEDESYNHKSGVTPREVAEDRGWDCFAKKEGGGA